MRLFIAIDFNEFSDYFQSLQEKISIPESKLSLPKAFHLTLKFLGEVQPHEVEIIKSRLKNIRFEAFKVFTNSIGFFPNKKNLRVIWLGLKPEEQIIELQESIDTNLKDMYKAERDFRPHITLARVKFISNKDIFLKIIEKIKPIEKKFFVEKFFLFKSTLKSSGALHEPIGIFHSSK